MEKKSLPLGHQRFFQGTQGYGFYTFILYLFSKDFVFLVLPLFSLCLHLIKLNKHE